MGKHILLGHGSGGKLSHGLINDLFFKYFENPLRVKDTDAAFLRMNSFQIGFTTDSFVVDPVFFPGGNIGHLAVSGTVNDLAVSGFEPKYLSAAFIIEEGFPLADLEIIVKSMAEEAKKADVFIITGDTKVVNKGQCDKIFINTAGVGEQIEGYEKVGLTDSIRAGDAVIINGYLSDHGMAVMAAREGMSTTNLCSDVSPLNGMIAELTSARCKIRFMRDITRGGLATVLNEIATAKNFGIQIQEDTIPVRENVRGLCELLGYDPLYVANEGKVAIIAAPEDEKKILMLMKNHEYGRHSTTIGKVTTANQGLVLLNTQIGGKRIINMLAGGQLPRIC